MAFQEVHTGFTFGFDGSKFSAIQKGVGRASTNLNTIAAKTEAFTQRMGGFVQRAKQLVGVYLGFRAVRSITEDYAQGADQIAKFSAGLGINAQEYQKLTFAAKLSGLTMEEMNMALPKFAKSAADAADGSKAMADAFSRAGLKLKGKKFLGDPIDMLKAFADGLKDIKDPIRKAQILQNSFGRAGKKMGVLMAQGSEGIKKAMDEAVKYGHVLSGKQLKDAENYNDEMLRAKSIMIGIRNTIASRLLPVLTKQLKAFRTWWVEGRNAERALRALKLVAIFTGIVIARLIVASVLRNVKLFVQGIWAGVQALRAMGIAGAAAAIKIWAIIAAFALVALVIEDLIGFAQGKDSVIGRLLGDTQIAKDLKAAIIDMAKAAKAAWEDSWEALEPALTKVWEALNKLWEAIEPLIGPAFKLAIDGMIFSFKGLAVGIRIVADLIVFQTKIWKQYASAAGLVTGVFSAITGKIEKVIRLSKVASDLLDKVLGRTTKIGSLNLAEKMAKIRKESDAVFASHSGNVLPGLFPAQPGLAFAGGPRTGPLPGAFTSRAGAGPAAFNSTANVSAGAVPVTVNVASGDPEKIAKAINAALPPAISRVFTNASRDLVKPPRGQT